MVLVLAAVLVSSTAYAGPPKTWSDLGPYLKGKYIAITTKDGKTMRGRFVSTRPDVIVLNDGKQVEITRASLVSLQIERSNLETYGHNVKVAYSDGFRNLFSANGLWGLIEVPGVTVYAVITAPLSALGDLFHNRSRSIQPVMIPAK